ncbi:MAG TPA: cupredoxin domain-containing protein [Candidatus Limnocylindria bacterium]|nr:cupredoxin domain-containing protein [Candidatus Limnocylindria bacterium]
MRSFILRRVPVALSLVAALALGACQAGASPSLLASGAQPPPECARVENGVINLSAENLEFSAPCMVANAGEAFTIHFENLEAVPHDVAVFQDSSKANEIMRGEAITGPEATADYEVEALTVGQYYFECTIHPQDMNGTLYVVEA